MILLCPTKYVDSRDECIIMQTSSVLGRQPKSKIACDCCHMEREITLRKLAEKQDRSRRVISVTAVLTSSRRLYGQGKRINGLCTDQSDIVAQRRSGSLYSS